MDIQNDIIRALSRQSTKVDKIFDMGLGWEVWAQIELGLEMKKTVGGGRAEYQLGKFEREATVYDGTEQRCDFMIEMGHAYVRHLHFAELKCLYGRETTPHFIARLKHDFQKIKTAEPKRTWVGQARCVTGWVVAITVNRARDGQIDRAMNKLAVDVGIQWACANITEDGVIKLWTWGKRFYDEGKRV